MFTISCPNHLSLYGFISKTSNVHCSIWILWTCKSFRKRQKSGVVTWNYQTQDFRSRKQQSQKVLQHGGTIAAWVSHTRNKKLLFTSRDSRVASSLSQREMTVITGENCCWRAEVLIVKRTSMRRSLKMADGVALRPGTSDLWSSPLWQV